MVVHTMGGYLLLDYLNVRADKAWLGDYKLFWYGYQ